MIHHKYCGPSLNVLHATSKGKKCYPKGHGPWSVKILRVMVGELRPMVAELRPMDRTSRTMDRTSRSVHGPYLTGRTLRPYMTGRTSRAVPSMVAGRRRGGAARPVRGGALRAVPPSRGDDRRGLGHLGSSYPYHITTNIHLLVWFI
jgi:hypothetical protein